MGFDVDSYKADDRTPEKLVSDLQRGLSNEAIAIRKFNQILERTKVEHPSIAYVGSDQEGEVILDGDKVANIDLFPDYLLKYRKYRRAQFAFIEVKICNPHSRFAYFKVKQLEQYCDMGSVIILFVMGFDTDNPRFALVEPEEILKTNVTPELVYGKETLKIPSHYFWWDDFQIKNRHREDLLEKQYIKSCAFQTE